MHSKGNHKQNKKTTYRIGENTSKQWDWQGINLQNIQTAQYQKNNPIKKMGRRPKQTFLQRIHTDGQQTHERILSITSQWRNANQNYNWAICHLTLVRMAIIKRSKNNKCWRACGEKGTLLHCWWKCKLVQPLWKTIWRFLKKLKMELPYDPNSTPWYMSKKKQKQKKKTNPQTNQTPHNFEKIHAPQRSQQHFLTIAKIWKLC